MPTMRRVASWCSRMSYSVAVAVAIASVWAQPIQAQRGGAAQSGAPVASSYSMWSVIPRGHRLQVFAERRFDAASGLRASTVFALELDREGIPWLGGDDGLYKYAGGTWRAEVLEPGFQNQQVRALLLPADGSRWIGTRRGLLHKTAGGTWQAFREADGIAGQVVFSLVESRAIDGTPRVVAGTARGVSYFDGRRFIALPLPGPMDPLGMMVAESVAPDGTPELWAASSYGGVARLNKGVWSYLGEAEGLATPDVQFLAVDRTSPKRAVYAAGSAGVFELDRSGPSPRFTRIPDSPRDAFRVEIVQSPGDVSELWVGLTDGRIFRRRDGLFRQLETNLSARHGSITLLKAVRGHGGGTAVYASSRAGYLMRISHGVAGALVSAELKAAANVNALWVDRDPDGRDAVFAGTIDHGVLRSVSGGSFISIPFAGARSLRTASFLRRTALSPPGTGAVGDSALLAIADSVPWVLRGARFEPLDAGLDGVRVMQLARVTLPDGRDATLAGTSDGVRLWTGSAWQRLWPEIRGAVSSFASTNTARGRELFLGGRQGVRVVRPNGVSTESFAPITAAGVGRGTVRRICTSAVGGNAHVFALDSDRGVLWRPLDGASWSSLPSHLTRVLSNLGVTDFACLTDGQLALSTFAGLALFDVASASPAQWRVVTQVADADGLPANGVLTVAPSASGANVLWVGTTFGVGVVDVARAAQLPPARLAMTVVSEAKHRPVGEGDALGVGENDVHVDPMLLTFHREELTQFRVRLKGAGALSSSSRAEGDSANGEWLDVPNRYYHDLPPGNYELTVWAYDWAGREYGPVQRHFTVLTPWWRTWVAVLGYMAAILLGLTLAYRWRVRTIRNSALQLVDSERRARDSERRFRTIFEQALDGHLLIEDGMVQAANAEAARLFGVSSPAALDGRDLTDMLGEVSVRNGSSTRGETLLETANGAVPVNFTMTDVPAADRVLRHVVIRDLTEVRKAEADRSWFEAQVREAQKLESLGTLAGGVAHDFNNLLGVIRGNAELARTALKRGRSNDDNLGAILDASDRARDIVRQILTFSRRSTPTREYVNLSRLVLDLEPLLRRMIPRTVKLDIEGADDAHLIMGDPTQLQQLLLNLVSNAEYAMRSSTNGLLTIALMSRETADVPPLPVGRSVVLQVRDTGAGMTEDVRSRIFEPFFTTKPTGEGTGLGMSVVHGIVTSHEGRAEVMSAPGQGTTFEIRFPQAVIEGLWDDELDDSMLVDEDEHTTEPPGVVELPTGDGDDMNVLEDSPYAGTTIVVVDDEPAVAQVVERALQHYGHLVHVFNHPEPALQFIQQQPSSVDLLITDQTMPGMTGDLLAESVHVLRADLPVLILTGFSHRLTPERVAAAKAHAVLLKPVELEVLKKRVDEALALTLRR